MDYNGQICRTPMERGSFMLPVMAGCSYNRCKFCNLFKEIPCKKLSREAILDEIYRVKNLGGCPQKVFLGDGDAFSLPMEDLRWVVDQIVKNFPNCQEINMDATITSILEKKKEDLCWLGNHQVRHLYVGIESGLDQVLNFMNKDHTLLEAYEGIKRLENTKLIFDAHIMTGIAGARKGQDNAVALAEFLARTKPARVVNFSLFLHNQVPLYQEIKTKRFIPATEAENLLEEIRLLKELSFRCTKDIWYEGFHDFIKVRVSGHIPKDSEAMIEKLQKVYEKEKNQQDTYALVTGPCLDLRKVDGAELVWDKESRRYKEEPR